MPKLWRAATSSPCGLAGAAKVVVVGAIVALVDAVAVVAGTIEVDAGVDDAGTPQPARREIINSVGTIMKMGLNKVQDRFGPSVIFFLAIVLTLLITFSSIQRPAFIRNILSNTIT